MLVESGSFLTRLKKIFFDQRPVGESQIGGEMTEHGTEIVESDKPPNRPEAGNNRIPGKPIMNGGIFTGDSEIVDNS